MSMKEELTKARSILLLDYRFWGMLAMRLKLVEEPFCETAATDGEVMLYNEDFIKGLSSAERIGTVAHEVMHCAMGDIWRIGDRDPFIWNMACDYVNNKMLMDAGFTLPKGALLDSQFDGKSKEEVYKIIYKTAKKLASKHGKDGKNGKGQGQGDGQGKSKGKGKNQSGQGQSYADKDLRDPGNCGGMFKPDNPQKAKKKQAQWRKATANAARLSKGDLPGDMAKKIMDEVIDPPLPWKFLLRDFIEKTARNDYNWSRPSRRYLPQGIVLPSLISDELPLVVVVGDTSGSTTEHQPRFASETSAVLASYKTNILFIQVDYVIQNVKEYATEDLPIEFTIKGYGGTSFKPAFEYIEKEGIQPACLIYLTDMEGDFPNDEPPYPVLWVSVLKNKKAPFGSLIEINDF